MREQFSTEAWLARAIQVTAGLTSTQVILPGASGWGNLQLADPAAIQLHPAYRVHGHAVSELCLALSGRAVMVLGGEVFELKAPRLVILPAGLAHGEGQLNKHPYELMWMGMGLDVAAGSFTASSSYKPNRGWRSRCRQRLPGIHARRLSEIYGSPKLLPKDWPLLQNELLTALVALHALALSDGKQVSSVVPDHSAVVSDIQNYLQTHLDQPLSLDDVAHLVRLSPNYANTVFRQHTGQTIHAWLLNHRMEKSMSLCQETGLPFRQIAQQVGFNDALYFSKAFRRSFGMSPSEARAEAGK